MRRQEQTINAASTRVSENVGRESFRRGLAKEREGHGGLERQRAVRGGCGYYSFVMPFEPRLVAIHDSQAPDVVPQGP